MSEPVTIKNIQEMMNNPNIRNSKPDQLIPNIVNALGIDVEPVTSDEVDGIRKVYFQAAVLEEEKWAKVPGSSYYIQIVPFKLKKIPENVRIVADVMIDKSPVEVDIFNEFISSIAVSGKSIIFNAAEIPPMNLTIALKCVHNVTGEVVNAFEEDIPEE